MTFQVWFTAAEIAELVVRFRNSDLPTSRRRIGDHAKRSGWDDQPVSLARRRAGSAGGGGMEYHITLLPDRLRLAIQGSHMQAVAVERQGAEVEAEKRRLAALKMAALSPRARSVMEARAEVLRSIEGYAHAQGCKRSRAIALFLTAQDDLLARQELEQRRDRGEILTVSEALALSRPLVLTSPDGFALTPATLMTANNRGPRAPKIGRSAVYEWFALRDGEGVAALAPKPSKTDEPIPVEFIAFLKKWAVPAKLSIPVAHKKYLEEHPDPARALSLTQVEYIVGKKLDNIQRHIGREGILTLRSRLPYISRSTEDLWPTTIYTADGKTFDAEVADPVSGRPMRPEITSVIDVATRRCVGVAVSRKENVIAVTEALRRACVSHGIPAIFYTDRGAGYKNKTFDGESTPDAAVGGLMGRLHIAKMHALPYNSQAKGIVERFNAQWNDLAKSFPTFIGGDMDKEASSRAHKATRRDIAQFGHSRLLPGWDEFMARLDALVAEYNDRPHSGLPKIEDASGRRRHMTPNECWASHVAQGWQPITVDAEEADDLFRPYEVRTVRRGLVTWNTNEYFHQALERYHEERVMVGYDLQQADKVWVREYDAETGQPGRLICVAEFGGNRQRYVPLTYQQAAEEARLKGKLKRLDTHRDAALDELRAPLLEHRPTPPMPEFTQPATLRVVPSVPELAAPMPPEANAPDPGPVRRVITSDAELAQLVIENPEELTPGRARLLREAMAMSSGRELLKISGVDLDALDRVLRSAA